MATRAAKESAQAVAANPATVFSTATLHKRYGWSALLFFMLMGLALEGLLGFKSEEFLLDPLRRELWSLAHFHGALLALVNLVYAQRADDLPVNQRRIASGLLVTGSILMPLGFFLGGLSHPEGDPGIGIFLVPIGALMLVYAIGSQAIAAWKS
ncbi:MAG: hypothetical protein RMM17_06120 [Acidobacteriota bacterium]|nr:hypothetical protein [Blastocatellia bacterium]MDW8412244.1 hypothetical protein [Acidobacteriota bacterium]